MIRFLGLRLSQAVLVLLVMSVFVFGLIGLMPGDPIDVLAAGDPTMSPEDAARLRALYGVDRPLAERYLTWLSRLLSGDLGYSRLFAAPVGGLLLERVGNTLAIMVPSFLLALLIAFPAGVAAACRPDSITDGAINAASFVAISMPSFWLALLLIMLFSVLLGWLPAGGMGPPGGGTVLDHLPYLVLPVLSLTLASVGTHTRYIRAAVRDQVQADHIRTARAKGAGRNRTVWRHVVPNALIPVIAIIALDLGMLVSGALVTETMFAWPGVGKLIADAVLGNDFNVALAALLLVTGMTLAGAFLADIAYVLVDPRIRFGGRR